MKSKNKYLVALSGIMLHLAIGSIYAYSMWIEPLNALNGWTKGDMKLAFSIAITTTGLSAAFIGKYIPSIGVTKVAIIGSLLYILGMFMSALSVYVDSYAMFLLSYGLIMGLGLGLCYVTPIGVIVQWFPNNAGAAAGVIVMSFAFGSIIATTLISSLVVTVGAVNTFLILAMLFTVMMIPSSFYLSSPQSAIVKKSDLVFYSAKDIVKEPKFYLLWSALTVNVCAGIAFIAIAAPMAEEYIKLSSAEIITFVAIIGLFNGLGRFLWSTISDKIGRSNTFFIMLMLQIVCFIILILTTNKIIVQVAFWLIISAYGGGFSVASAYMKDNYSGTKLTQALGYILTAWSFAAIIGPQITSLDAIIGFKGLFIVFASLMLVGIIMIISLKKVEKKQI